MFYYTFSMMYWTGLRIVELLDLNTKDFDFRKGVLSINKSDERLQGNDVIIELKTPKSNRIIKITDTLCEEIQVYIRNQCKMKAKDRLFLTTKSYLTNEMIRCCKEAGVKKITLHSIRHSHVSLLINLGSSTVAIADRVGNERIYLAMHICFPVIRLKF